ncbi:MAG: DUF3253 domain-containing protein [Marmoricola sp.]
MTEDPLDRALEEAILDLLEHRDPGKTICPSEAARAVAASRPATDGSDQAWRDLMDPARRAVRRLVGTRQVVATQGGRVVDPVTARGPIRVRLAHPDR